MDAEKARLLNMIERLTALVVSLDARVAELERKADAEEAYRQEQRELE
jgi:hypothetical protein